MQINQQHHIAELIEETVQRRVSNAIQEYASKNELAFIENKIAGIEWNLRLRVIAENINPLPLPKPRNFFQRFIDFLTHLWQKAENAPERADQRAHSPHIP